MASFINLQATCFLHMMKSSPFSTLTHSLSLSIPVRQAAEACKQWSTVLYWVLHKARGCTKRYYFCSSYLPVSAPVFIEHASMKGEKDTKIKRQHCGPPPVVLLCTHLLKKKTLQCVLFNITVSYSSSHLFIGYSWDVRYFSRSNLSSPSTPNQTSCSEQYKHPQLHWILIPLYKWSLSCKRRGISC